MGISADYCDGLDGPETERLRRRVKWRRRMARIALVSLGILAALGAAAAVRYLGLR